jgi:hypothetical protein
MRVARGKPVELPYRFNPLPAELGIPLSCRAARDSILALHGKNQKPPLSPEQIQYKDLAERIIDSSRLGEDGSIKASIPAEAGDAAAVYALDFYYRWKTARTLAPNALYGAVDVSKLTQTLSSDYILPPDPKGLTPGRTLSVLLVAPYTVKLDFDAQRRIISALKGVPATPIEQLLAALVLKCRYPEKSSFKGIIRGSERGKALLDTELSGLKVVIVSEDAEVGISMSMSKTTAGAKGP